MPNNDNIQTRHISTNAEIVIFLLCGILVFSPLSSMVSQEILHLPISLPELLFLPFYFYLRESFDFSVNYKKLLLFTLMILTLISISIIAGKFRIGSVLSTSRGYVYIALLYSIFHNKKVANIYPILMIAIGSMIGWLIMSLLSFRLLISSLVTEESLVVYGNMIALCLAISIPILFGKSKWLPYILFLGLAISFTSGLRRQIIIFVMSFLLSQFLSMKLSLMKTIRTVFVIIMIMIAISPFYANIKEGMNNISPFLYYRLFEKSEKLFTGELTEGDVERVSNFNNFIDNLGTNIIPQGFVSKRTLTDEGTGIYMDSPYIELFYTFSITGSLIFIVLFIKSISFHFRNFYVYNIKESGLCVVAGVIILVLLLIEGSFLNFVYTTPFTGYILARIFSRENLIAA